jgi:hypothetical protein
VTWDERVARAMHVRRPVSPEVHNPPDIDWALFFNRSLGKPVGPEVHREFRDGMRQAIESVRVSLDVDFFDRAP